MIIKFFTSLHLATYSSHQMTRLSTLLLRISSLPDLKIVPVSIRPPPTTSAFSLRVFCEPARPPVRSWARFLLSDLLFKQLLLSVLAILLIPLLLLVRGGVLADAWPKMLAASILSGESSLQGPGALAFDDVNTPSSHNNHNNHNNQDSGHRRLYAKDTKLLEQAWLSDSGQAYLQEGVLEYQPREGFCAPTTTRVMLRSLGEGWPALSLPPLERYSPLDT